MGHKHISYFGVPPESYRGPQVENKLLLQAVIVTKIIDQGMIEKWKQANRK